MIHDTTSQGCMLADMAHRIFTTPTFLTGRTKYSEEGLLLKLVRLVRNLAGAVRQHIVSLSQPVYLVTHTSIHMGFRQYTFRPLRVWYQHEINILQSYSDSCWLKVAMYAIIVPYTSLRRCQSDGVV